MLPSSGLYWYNYFGLVKEWVIVAHAGIKHAVSYLDSLSKAALPQHLSMDEVRWAKDPMRPIGHDAQRL